jgi:hypothetical protein
MEDINHNGTLDGSSIEQARREGKKESLKEVVKEEERNKEKLKTLLVQSQRCLYSLSTVFPFKLFTDTFSIEEDKINLVYRMF